MSNRPSSLLVPSRSPGNVTRRNVLYGSGLVVATATASGCGIFSTDPDTEAGGDKGPEAPMLADRVEAGELPPVEERLPVEEDRMVVDPTDRVGVYGGTWRTTYTDLGDAPWFHRTVGYEPLMRWTRDWTTVIPNVAKSIEASPDGHEFEIRLRQGMKWSDGEPFTTADLEFAFEHVLTNQTLLGEGAPHAILMLGDELMTMEVVDEVTLVVRFSGPNGLFLLNNARQVDGDRLISFPRHYCEQFHPEFNENAEQEAEEAGYESWAARFDDLIGPNNIAAPFTNPDLPTLKAWIPITPMGDGDARFERNPFYWKVDPEGSQLPYIDDVTFDSISDSEVMLTQAANGAFDFHSRHFNTLENRPVLESAADAEGFRLLPLEESHSNNMVISLNLAHPDDGVRAMHQDRDFRIALSHAINRERLINAVFEGQGEAWQAAPAATSEWYDEEFATQYTEYDPDLANQILDDAGYDERDGDGYRLRPDGERCVVTVHIAQEVRDFWNPGMELVAEDWEAVGIQAVLDPMPRDNWTELKDANEHFANVWVGDAGHFDALFQPRWYFAYDFDSHFGDVWQFVWRGGQPEEEPPPVPDAMARQQELYDQLQAEPDENTRNDMFREILEIAKEQFWVIGTVRVADSYAVVNDNLENVGDGMPESATYNTPAASNPEQWFFSS